MEASKSQISFEPASGDGEPTVRALGDRLVIEALTVSDARAARLVRERAEAGAPGAETVSKAIEVGARILDAEGAAANVDYVKREVEASLGELGREMSATLESGSEQLAERIAAAFGADRSDSVQQQIKRMLEEASNRQQLELTRMLSAEDGSNPLVAVQTRMGKAILESDERHRAEVSKLRESHVAEARANQAQIAELKEQVTRLLDRDDADRLLAEAEEAGTRKGRSFEERVHAAIERIADGRGDSAIHTGELANEAGSKKGDCVVEIGAADGRCQGRVVLEAKDKKLSKNDAWRELNAALADRDAGFAVLVVAGEGRVPAGRETLTEYEGNKMIAAVDREEPDSTALEYAYRYARARVLMAAEAELNVDAAGVRAAAEVARSKLKELNKARRSLTSITSGAESVREAIDSIDAEVLVQLERIDALVETGDQA